MKRKNFYAVRDYWTRGLEETGYYRAALNRHALPPSRERRKFDLFCVSVFLGEYSLDDSFVNSPSDRTKYFGIGRTRNDSLKTKLKPILRLNKV